MAEDEKKNVDVEVEQRKPGLGRWALNAPDSCCPAARRLMQSGAFDVGDP